MTHPYEPSEAVASSTPTLINRRTLTRGLAWAAPVVAVGAAAKASAQSPLIDIVTAAACKYPGNSAGDDCSKAYEFGVYVNNFTNTDLWVDVTIIEELTGTQTKNLTIAPNSTFTDPFFLPAAGIPIGSPLKLNLLGSGASANVAATITANYSIEYPPGSGTIYNFSESFSYPGAIPCKTACPDNLGPAVFSTAQAYTGGTTLSASIAVSRARPSSAATVTTKLYYVPTADGPVVESTTTPTTVPATAQLLETFTSTPTTDSAGNVTFALTSTQPLPGFGYYVWVSSVAASTTPAPEYQAANENYGRSQATTQITPG